MASRTVVNFWLDSLLLVTVLLLLWLMFVIRFAFPPSESSVGWTLWGYSYSTWYDVAFSVSCLFAVEVTVHIMLHWNWVCGVLQKQILRRKRDTLDDGEKTLWGVAMLASALVVFGALLAWAVFSATPPETM